MVEATAKDFTVVIDAGHGGKDPGAVSANGKVYEKNVRSKAWTVNAEDVLDITEEVSFCYDHNANSGVCGHPFQLKGFLSCWEASTESSST